MCSAFKSTFSIKSSFFRYIDSVNVGSVRFKFFHYPVFRKMLINLSSFRTCFNSRYHLAWILSIDPGAIASSLHDSTIYLVSILYDGNLFRICPSFSSSPEVYRGAFNTLFLFSSSSCCCEGGSIKLVRQL